MTSRTHRTTRLLPRIPNWPPDGFPFPGGGHDPDPDPDPQPEPEDGRDTPSEFRRYSLTADRFRCVDESGLDDPWGTWGWNPSDEVQWIFTTKTSGRDSVTRTTHSFGDVDSGDTFDIPVSEGRLVEDVDGAIGVSIQLTEVDQGGNWDDRVEQAFERLEGIPQVAPWVANVPGVVRDFIADFIGDDLMGANSFLFRTRDLERRLPTVGSLWFEDLYFGGDGGDLPWPVSGGPDYHLRLKVERVADAEIHIAEAVKVEEMANATR